MVKLFDYDFPEDRLYDKEHIWLKEEGGLLRIGVTDFFQKMANDIVFIEIPATGRVLEIGKPFSSLESGKWVGRVKCTVSGAVVNANTELNDFPYLLNESPYDEGWIVDIEPAGQDYKAGLFDLNDPAQKKEYEDFLEAEIQRIASMTK